MVPIGSVVRSGRIVARLGSVVRRFEFMASTHRQWLQPLKPVPDTAPIIVPSRSPRAARNAPVSMYPGNILYQTWMIEAGWLLVIGGGKPGGGDLVLPCPEIFRTALAPHAITAQALLSGPWPQTVHRVLDLDGTKVVADDPGPPRWEATAAVPGLSDHHLTVAANLWLSEAGRAAASGVWLSTGAASGRGSIRTILPFEWDVLSLEVASIGIGTGPRFWFGYEIVSVRWPDPPLGPPRKIDLFEKRSRQEDETGQGGKGPGPGTVLILNPKVPNLEADQRDEGSGGGPPTAIVADGTAWTNAPEVTKRVIEIRRGATGHRRPRVEETENVSPSSSSRGRGDAATVQPQALDPHGGGETGCARFDLILAALERLVDAGSISGHRHEPSPRDSSARRGEMSVWAFPELPIKTAQGSTERWYVLRFGFPPVRRTALVLTILVGSRAIHLIEIEPRQSAERFQTLIFTMSAATTPLELQRMVTRLLRAAARARGVWRNVLDEVQGSEVVSGIHGSALFTHVIRPTGPDGSASSDGLDEARLLARLGEAMEAPRPKDTPTDGYPG